MMPTYLEFMQLYNDLNENTHFLIPVVNYDDLEQIDSYLNNSKIKYSVEVNAQMSFCLYQNFLLLLLELLHCNLVF